LPVAEWPRLAGTEAETVWPTLDPTASIVVVERGGAIVGCHILMRVWHVECLWIAPGSRGKGSVARRLWRAVQQTARTLGAGAVWTTAIDDRVRGLLAHVGATKLEGDHYIVPVRG
jgi:N-acetylglutamate synthase-like GNAT family acetyltransferase